MEQRHIRLSGSSDPAQPKSGPSLVGGRPLCLSSLSVGVSLLCALYVVIILYNRTHWALRITAQKSRCSIHLQGCRLQGSLVYRNKEETGSTVANKCNGDSGLTLAFFISTLLSLDR